MGEVFLAEQVRDASYRKQVCIKRMHPHLAHDRDFVALFEQEARLGALLRHTNIVPVIDFGADRGAPFIVMEYVRGADLKTILKKRPKLPLDVVWVILHDIAEAFVHAHSAQKERPAIIHRDFSPGNLIVTPEGACLLTDFGIAKPLVRDYTKTDSIKGKLRYFAPETLVHQVYDVRTDLFAVGVTIYRAVTGIHPFDGDADFLTLQRIVAGEREPVKALRPDCPDDLVGIIDKLLMTDPAQRFQSVLELSDALRPVAARTRRELGALAREAAGIEAVPAAAVPEPELAPSGTWPAKRALRAGTSAGGQQAISPLAETDPAPTRPERPIASRLPQSQAVSVQVTSREAHPPTRPLSSSAHRSSPSANLARPALALSALGTLVILGIVVGAATYVLNGKWTSRGGPPADGPSSVVMASAPAEEDAGAAPLDAAPPTADAGSSHTDVNDALVVDDPPSGSADASASGGEGSVREAPEPMVQVDSGSAEAFDAPTRHGSLRVTVYPWGDVFVNGRRQGRSPVEVRLPAGMHSIAVGRSRVEQRRRVRIRAGRRATEHFDLE